MTIFNPDKKDTLSICECLDPAMGITEEDDAIQYFSSYVEYIRDRLKKTPGKEDEDAVSIAKHNLGYWAGLLDEEVQERTERLFSRLHISGLAESNRMQDCFSSGLTLALTTKGRNGNNRQG